MIDTDKYTGHTPGPWVAEHMYWRKKGSHGGGLREEGAEEKKGSKVGSSHHQDTDKQTTR